ncbi:MAG: hypothetical protein EBV06_09240 [Planctomycetia bacterium]|nr:hypothetical protein [Planctomycetia bacterium]
MGAWNFDKLKITKSIQIDADLLSVTSTPDKEFLWIGSSDFKVYAIDMAAEKSQPFTLEGHRSYVSGIVLAGKSLVSAGWDRRLIWWEVEKRQPIRIVDAHQRWIRQLTSSPDQKLLASISDDMTCKLWETTTGKLVRELKGHESRLPKYDYPNKLYACAFSPDGKLIAAADELCQVIIWETTGGKEAARIDTKSFLKQDWDRNNHPYGGLRSITFTPDGKSLILAGMQNTDVAIINGPGLVQMVDWRSGKLTHEFKVGSNIQYEALWVDSNSEWLLALVGGSSQKPTLSVFDLKQKSLLKDLASPMPSFGLTVNEKRNNLYTVGRGQVVRWECPA